MSSELPSYGGWCGNCGCEHRLDGTAAVEAAEALKRRLDDSGCLDDDLPPEQRDERLRLQVLDGPAGGQMFGVLVAENGRRERQTLVAFSGQFEGVWNVRGWAAPIVNIDAKGQLVPHQFSTENRIKEIGANIDLAGEERLQLQNERRAVSKQLMRDIHDAYVLHNARGDERPLPEAFVGGKGMPSGTGDCCAPKLLEEAYRQQLRPVALLEFWWGGPKAIGRQHGAYYGACADKCEPILGFMLCGVQR